MAGTSGMALGTSGLEAGFGSVLRFRVRVYASLSPFTSTWPGGQIFAASRSLYTVL